MKRVVLFLILFTLTFKSFSQLDFSQKIVMENIDPSPSVAYIEKFDMDYDGDLDLISANSHHIIWYENTDGKNSKITSHLIPIKQSSYLKTLKFLDINNDGFKDIITHDRQKIHLFKGIDKNGNFSEQETILEVYTSLNSVTFNDLDNDGDIDIVFSHKDNYQPYQKLKWLENTDSKGSFTNKTIHSYTKTSSLNIVDLNNDNIKDILSYDYSNNKVDIFYNNGNQSFTKTSTTIKANNSKEIAVIPYDIDKDNDLDLLVINSEHYTTSIKKIEIHKNDGQGNFTYFNEIDTKVTDISSLHVKDIDNDNDLDILFSSKNKGSVVLCKNQNNNFNNLQTISDNILGLNNVTSYDFNNDGENDIIVSSRTNNQISWFNNADNFSEEKELTTTLIDPEKSFPADIDGDNDMDIVTISKVGITWYENKDGKGDFGSQKIIDSNVISRTIQIADIDNDNDNDIIVGEIGSNYNRKLLLYKNTDGKGTYSKPITLDETSSILSIATSDIDNDGDIDIIYCNETSDIKYILNKNGKGDFESTPTTINTSFYYQGTQVLSSDINNDGFNDIIAYNPDGRLAWFKNTNGMFNTENIIHKTVSHPIHHAITNDIDNDGDIDIIVSIRIDSSSNAELVWFENIDAKGDFGSKKIINKNIKKTHSIIISDLDNDNDNDIITSHSEKISWHENTDGRIFSDKEQIILQNDNYYNFISNLDFNLDTKEDILLSSFKVDYKYSITSSKIKLLKNNGLLRNEITGFVKLNSNGNCDSNSEGVANVLVTSSNGNETLSTFTLENGFYQFFPDIGDYTTEVISPIKNIYNSTPSIYQNTFTNRGNTVSNSFCLSNSETVEKISLDIIPLKEVRPGFSTSYQIVCKNTGTENQDGQVTFQFDDSKLLFLNADETIVNKKSNSISFNFKNLKSLKSKIITVNFKILPPPTVNIDDILTSIITLSQNNNETLKVNYNQKVIGSYDPNDILVLEGKEIYVTEINNYLHYTIRFQNTGTASAINVRVNNNLDDKLDWNSLKMINSSHKNRVEIKNGKNLNFIFNNINLPDSISNEPKSHGFISYKIKPKSNSKLGDVFNNEADIFFDFNLPIKTNTVATKIVEKIILPEESILKTYIYPNPSNDLLNIFTDLDLLNIKIFNNLGQKTTSSTKKNIDITNLPSGLYYIVINFTNGSSKTMKFIKK